MKEIIYNNDNINLRDVTSKSVRIKVLLINNGKLVIGNEDGCFMFIGGHQEDNEEMKKSVIKNKCVFDTDFLYIWR